MIPIATVALAQGVPCEMPFTEFDLRALVARSESAIADDDALAHKRLFDEFVAQVHCLDHQLPEDAYARLLVSEAIVRHLRKEEWEPLLATALLLIPDLADVPEYLLQQLPRPTPPALGPVDVPEDAALFVDGRLYPTVPALAGEHVVQVWRDEEWHSLWLDGVEVASIPEEWLRPKPPRVVEVEKPDETWQPVGRGSGGLAFGVFDARQMVDNPGDYLADGGQFGGLSAIVTRGWQPVGSYGGVFWDAALRLVAPSVRTGAGEPQFEPDPVALPTLYVGPAVVLEHVSFGFGAGFFQLQKVEAGQPTTLSFPQARAVLGTRRDRASFDVGGGFSPSAASGAVKASWVVSRPAQIGWAFGFGGDLGLAWFREDPLVVTEASPRSARVLQAAVTAHFDLVWDADR